MLPLCAASVPSWLVPVCPNQLPFPPVVNDSAWLSSAVGRGTVCAAPLRPSSTLRSTLTFVHCGV